ncbi:hypothetical protein GCM10010203_34150 [Actinomadura yumaensis]
MKEPNPNENDIEQRSSPSTDDGTPPTPPPGPNLADTDPEPDKPTIRVAPGELHLNRADAEKVLADTGAYFTSGSGLVRIIKKGGGGVAVELVNEQTLRTFLSASINWERKGRDNLWLRCDPPQSIVKALLFGQDRDHLKPLNGIARQPYFGDDGALIARPGYDPGTGVYGVFDPSDYRGLENASREDAEHAISYLNHLLDEFEFETDADRSAALSAIITAVVRPSLSVAPAFNITATTSGSGKSYLADVITLFAGPDEPYRVSYPSGADEAGKLIVTVLNEKPAAVVFDDMQTNWKPFGAINRMLTSPTTTERMLGTNRSATVPTRALFLGTGNNIEPERDLRRRVVTIRLAPRHETPALRSFHGDPVADMRNHRAMAVACVLTVISAFRAAGEPMAAVRPIGTYDEWSRLCRQPLIWMGLADPAQSLIDQVSHDPDRQALAALLDVWFDLFGSKSVTVRQIIAKAEEKPLLMEALEDLPVMDGRHINRGKLGWFISKNRGRRADQLRIEAGDSSERRSWKIVAV